jgi:hypothetical protein
MARRIGERMPARLRQFVRADTVTAALSGAARIDPGRFRHDVDGVLDADATPRP